MRGSESYYITGRMLLRNLILDLFKSLDITEWDMQHCIASLLQYKATSTTNEAEEGVKIIYFILADKYRGIGALLDTPSSRAQMDGLFAQLTELSRNGKVGPLMRIKIQVTFSLK